MFTISGLKQFGLNRNMQNQVELFDRGPGQKMGYNTFLKNQQMACKLLKNKQQMGSMFSAMDLEADLWAY